MTNRKTDDNIVSEQWRIQRLPETKPKPGHRQRTENQTTSYLAQHRREVKGIPRTVMKVVTIFRGKKQQWLSQLDTQHCLATLLFFYCRLYLQLSGTIISKISHTSQIIDLSTFSLFPSHFKFLIENKNHPNSLNFLSPALWIPLCLTSVFIHYLVYMCQALWWPLEVTMESKRPQPCPHEVHSLKHGSQTGRRRANCYP